MVDLLSSLANENDIVRPDALGRGRLPTAGTAGEHEQAVCQRHADRAARAADGQITGFQATGTRR